MVAQLLLDSKGSASIANVHHLPDEEERVERTNWASLSCFLGSRFHYCSFWIQDRLRGSGLGEASHGCLWKGNQVEWETGAQMLWGSKVGDRLEKAAKAAFLFSLDFWRFASLNFKAVYAGGLWAMEEPLVTQNPL